MSYSRASVLALAVSFALFWACSGSNTGSAGPGTRPAEAAIDGSTPAAEVNGEAITWAELDEKAGGALAKVRQEEYEIRSRVVDELIAERLIEAAAREGNISSEELLEQELERRVKEPSAEYVESLYEQNKARFGTQDREEALARIAEILVERAEQQARVDLADELREKAEVAVHLDPPRVAVDIPPGAPATGPHDAPVTIVEFSDYQCPYCHRAQSVVEQILDEYAGRVRFVHLDYPLDFHAEAVPAARAARCAGEQGRFWDFHRSLMTEKGTLKDADLKARAAALDLDAGRFARCLASDRHDDAIQAEFDLGSNIGVTGTPAYFINGRLVSGARPFPAFAEVIDAELGL